MRSTLSRFRVSPAVVLSAIAVFFAIGGIGFAAATIGTSNIKNGAVTSKKIKNGTIKKKDIGFDATGPAGPAGPQGPAGPTGPAGPGAGQGFSFLVTDANEPAVVSAGDYTLEVTQTAGSCDEARLLGPTNGKESTYQEFDFGTASLSTDNFLNDRGDDPNGNSVGTSTDMYKIIVRANDDSTSAVFEFTLDEVDGCHFAGEAVAPSA